MKIHTLTIQLTVETPLTAEQLKTFYHDLLFDMEGTEHKTHEVIIKETEQWSDE